MLEILENTWFVSIVGGIISGIISGILVYFITDFILKKKNRKEYLNRVESANIAVLNYLRDYVLNNGIPEVAVLDAVKATTAGDYNVKKDELLSNREICQKYVQEIIGNVYIPNDGKVKYLGTLQKYIESCKEEIKTVSVFNVVDKNEKRMASISSVIAAIATVLASLIPTLIEFFL